MDKHIGLPETENQFPHRACRRLIERFGGPNCAVPSAQVTEPARHVTVSNRLTDEQMCAGVCVLVCVCIFKHVNLSLLCDHFFPPLFFFRVLRQRFLSWITEKWQMQMHTIKSPCVCVWRFLVCFIIFRIYQRRWHGHCCCQYCYWYNSLTNVIGIEWISINQLSSTISPVTSTMKQIASGIKQRKRTKRLRTKHAY